MKTTRRAFFPILAAIALLALGLSAQPEPIPEAQGQTGELVCKVLDGAGNALAGVNVSLEGLTPSPHSQLSSGEGTVRFPGLAPGTYQLKAELEGFATVEYPNISIIAGKTTEFEIVMKPAGVLPPGPNP
jgi:hypothetical protein